jgi:hypothetical protein
VKKQEHTCRIAARRQRPFGRNAVGVGRLQPDVGGERRRRTNGIEPFAPLGKAGGSGPGAQQFANGINLATGHVQISASCSNVCLLSLPAKSGCAPGARQYQHGFVLVERRLA